MTKSGQGATGTEKHAIGLAPAPEGRVVIAAINTRTDELSLHHASSSEELTRTILALTPLLVAVKTPSLGLAGDIAAAGVPILPVQPAEVKKHATGKGNANKDLMVATAARRWNNVNSFSEADAAWLAHIAANT